jgi:hypothetical protein
MQKLTAKITQHKFEILAPQLNPYGIEAIGIDVINIGWLTYTLAASAGFFNQSTMRVRVCSVSPIDLAKSALDAEPFLRRVDMTIRSLKLRRALELEPWLIILGSL